jgi:hypothetical protein
MGLSMFVLCLGAGHPATAADSTPAAANSAPAAGSPPPTGGISVEAPAKLSMAEQWAKNRAMPEFLLPDQEEQKKKAPLRSLVKGIAKGAASEIKATASGLAKDMVLVFSVQDVDPYDKSGPPSNRPAIIYKFTLIDGSTAYLRRFPDNSFAIEDGFADGTVIVRNDKGEFIVKYPNGARGKVVFQSRNTILVYRPDNTITTYQKTSDGGYTINNDKLGYMGSARRDTTGINYELNEW